MDIYVVPVGADRYELYCEIDADAPGPGGGEAAGWRARAAEALRRGIAFVEGERERRRASEGAGERRGRWQRLRDRAVAFLAARIAEQRVLWHLRGQAEATAHFPSDLGRGEALDVVRRLLRRDAERHRRWVVIDLLGLLACAPLTLLPGPNLPAFYFAFRVGGHLFSYLGARHGLTLVAWHLEGSEALAGVRAAAHLVGPQRAALLRAAAEQLHLRHLDAFVDRTVAAAA